MYIVVGVALGSLVVWQYVGRVAVSVVLPSTLASIMVCTTIAVAHISAIMILAHSLDWRLHFFLIVIIIQFINAK